MARPARLELATPCLEDTQYKILSAAFGDVAYAEAHGAITPSNCTEAEPSTSSKETHRVGFRIPGGDDRPGFSVPGARLAFCSGKKPC